jgi:c-di-GMP-binding flagellar brake protein YcgR
MRFITTLPLQVDDKINIVLNIKLADRNVPITTKLNGKVIRVVSLPVKGKPQKVSVGVEFIYASSREQNEMVRLMFALQRQTR